MNKFKIFECMDSNNILLDNNGIARPIDNEKVYIFIEKSLELLPIKQKMVNVYTCYLIIKNEEDAYSEVLLYPYLKLRYIDAENGSIKFDTPYFTEDILSGINKLIAYLLYMIKALKYIGIDTTKIFHDTNNKYGTIRNLLDTYGSTNRITFVNITKDAKIYNRILNVMGIELDCFGEVLHKKEIL